MVPDSFRVDEQHRMWVGEVPIARLVKELGTPLYILDYQSLIRRMHAYRDALRELSPAGTAYYAGKAFLVTAMAQLLGAEGLGLDVVSGGELYTALSSGFDPSQIIFHGNVKTDQEIRYALESRIGYIVADSMDELDRLSEIAEDLGTEAPVLLRLTPGIDAHTHDFIRTGHFNSKFGFAMAEGLHDRAVERALGLAGIRLVGLHAHIGSQILEEEPFVANAEALLRYGNECFRRLGWWPQVLDIGGGLGVRYGPEDQPPDLSGIVARVAERIAEWTPAGLRAPEVFMEPGRSIVAEAGMTVYRVLATKSVPGGKRFVAVDGGMGDNIRPALYQARYQARIDGKPMGEADETVTLAGRYCETGDVLIEGAELPRAEAGDVVAVFGTGAYNYAMASNYNRVPRPPVVLVNGGRYTIWVERESWADLVRLDRPWQPI